MLETRKNQTPKVALALILGSRAGALFSGENLYKQLMNDQLLFSSTRVLADMSPWERFGECYTILKQSSEEIDKSELTEIVKHALDGINFSKADISLAELIKQDFFKLIISASVDELLYDAMAILNMIEGRDFISFPLPSHLIEKEIVNDIVFHKKQDACKIIRISDDAKKLVYNLTQPDAQEADSHFIKRLLERLRVKEALVVGLDPLWDRALMADLSERMKTIWFVNEDRSVMEQFLARNENHVEQCKCILGENGSYEKFLIALYWDINKDIPRHYDLLFDVIGQLRSMQSKLNSLENEITQTKDIVKRLANSIDEMRDEIRNRGK